MSITQEQLEATLTVVLGGLKKDFDESSAGRQSEMVSMKEQFADLKGEVHATFEALRAEFVQIRQEIRASEDRVVEHLGRAMHVGFAEQEDRIRFMIHEAETGALRGMYDREKAHNRRLHSVETLQENDRIRLGILEGRVLELESRANLTPPPAPPSPSTES